MNIAQRHSRSLPRMIRRDPQESHRAATPLELFFDLVFVVAVSAASSSLLKIEEEGHLAQAVGSYSLVFFGIWWAWMNFTWFATSYDTDDWVYRVLTIVQMGGALTLAAGVAEVARPENPDFTLSITGYVIMRVVMVIQWLRVAISDPESRKTALAYAIGIATVQVYWVIFGLTASGESYLPWFLLGIILELSVPVIAERFHNTTWHLHHITERYGLFTIIVLGESILASSKTIFEAKEDFDAAGGSLILLAVSALVIVAGMWWLYFSLPQHELITGLRSGLFWGYGHYFIFASAAAFSTGLEVEVLMATHKISLDPAVASATFCLPVAIFVFFVWLLIIRPQADAVTNAVFLGGVIALALSAITDFSISLMAVIMILLVAYITWWSQRRISTQKDVST